MGFSNEKEDPIPMKVLLISLQRVIPIGLSLHRLVDANTLSDSNKFQSIIGPRLVLFTICTK